MILTYVLDQTTRTFPGTNDGNVNINDIHSVPFTFENFGERDYEIIEITSDKQIISLDGSDNVLSLPLTVTSGSQVTIKFKFTIGNRETLPLSVFVTTTEQGRTDHVIRISQEIVEPIEEPTSELQVVGDVIDLEKDLSGEVLSTNSGVNPYTITFDVKNVGVSDLDIFELVFIDNELNKHDITTIGTLSNPAGDGSVPDCITNGYNISSGNSVTISFTIDLSTTGLFGTNLLSLDVTEDVSRDGFDLSLVGSIYLRSNSLKSYYSPIRFSEDLSTTVDVGVFIIPITGTLYVSSAIEILSNTEVEGSYDTRKQSKISLENLIIGTNRRTEQLIIKNYGIDSFNITGIASNYEIGSSDALSFYDDGTEVTFPLSIAGGEIKNIDIYFDNIQMIDDAETTNAIDDQGSEVSINKEFHKTITITTEAGVFNTDDNNELQTLVPFSLYKNQYSSPYDWVFIESRNRMSLQDGNGDFYSGATYELPFGYGITQMNPSEQKVVQIRIKNNASSIKYFKIEIVDNNKYWKNRPYLVQGGINTSVNKEDALYFQLNPGEITGTTPKDGSGNASGDNFPLLCIIQTNAGNEMQYEYMTEVFDEKYDLKKEGENIVIKVTEGEWTDGSFIVKTDIASGTTEYYTERSMVQYIVATWQTLTFTYWGTTIYNTESYYPTPNENERVEFFRPRDFDLYSTSNYTHESTGSDQYQKEYLYTSQTIIPITRAWAVSKVDPPKETFEKQGFSELFSKQEYSLQNLNTGFIDGELLDFGEEPPAETRYHWSKNKYTIDYSFYPAKEWLNELGKTPVEIPPKTVELWNSNNYLYDDDEVNLIKGDAVVVPPLGYEIRYHWSENKYNYTEETVSFNWRTRYTFSNSYYTYVDPMYPQRELVSLSKVDVQPASYQTWYHWSKNKYTHESTGSDQYKKEELKLIAPQRHICYSLSSFSPVFDWAGDMFPQLIVDVVESSIPKTVYAYSMNNYKFNFVPASVEPGIWEVIKNGS